MKAVLSTRRILVRFWLEANKVLSLFSVFFLGIISFSALFAVRFHYRRKGLRKSIASPVDSRLWQEIATGLFANYDHELTADDRIDLALRSGMRRLHVGCGIITLNGREGSRVIAVVGADDVAPEWLRGGREVSLALTYCGLLNESRETLAIDFASLSDWRHHSAHRDLGWETFIGTRRLLSTGEYLVVGFFDWRAREQIYGQEEKIFVAQLASWITAIRESSGEQVRAPAFLPDFAQPEFETATAPLMEQ